MPKSVSLPPSGWRDPRFAMHAAAQDLYRAVVEDATAREPASNTQLNTLEIGASDLNHWGYAIAAMCSKLTKETSPSKQASILSSISAMFQQQNDFVIATACQEIDFPETRFICQLRSVIMHWLIANNFPPLLFPINMMEIQAGKCVSDFDISELEVPTEPDFGDKCQIARVKALHAQNIYHRPRGLTPQGVEYVAGPMSDDKYKPLIGNKALLNVSLLETLYTPKNTSNASSPGPQDDHRCPSVQRKAEGSHTMDFARHLLQSTKSSSDSKEELVEGPSELAPWHGVAALPRTDEQGKSSSSQKERYNDIHPQSGYSFTWPLDLPELVVLTPKQIKALKDELSPYVSL
ncbi:hypothetical protein C8J56DRAFT_904928 [Mycena floridula]|nr:hypothetical protein C8J56DRAFT_904928 [Mycena floridula]